MQFCTLYTLYHISIYHIFIAIHELPAVYNEVLFANASQY